jgi:Pyruvate/2-oxoacid:ferredoxin oxidoreductase gamma subunit
MVRHTFMLCLAILTLIGCGSPSPEQSPALEYRIDAVLALQEMFATKTVSKTNLESIKENSSQLADSETDQKKLVTLAEKLLKAKKGSDTIQSISREMAALIPLPEKYATYRP